MSVSWPPKKNTIFTFGISLVSQADTKLFQNNPTLAAGDVLVSTDFGATSNLDTLPVVTPASSDLVKVTLSATEMNGDDVDVIFSDAAGAEWADKHIHFKTARLQLDDLDPLDIATAQAATATSITFVAGAQDAHVGDVVRIVSNGTAAADGQQRFITAYATSTNVATVDTWTTTPTGTIVYAHFPVPPGVSTGVTVGSMNTDVVDSVALATSAVVEIADGYLDRDMSTGADSGTSAIRTPRNALRSLRNRIASDATQIYVYGEDDTTIQWTASISTAVSTDPHITGADPNS